jgi:hypothetical protein
MLFSCPYHRDCQMCEVDLGGVIVDVCRWGDVHFDPGELQSYMNLVMEKEGHEPKPIELPLREKSVLRPGLLGLGDSLVQAFGGDSVHGIPCRQHRMLTIRTVGELPTLKVCPEGCVFFNNGELDKYVAWLMKRFGYAKPRRGYAPMVPDDQVVENPSEYVLGDKVHEGRQRTPRPRAGLRLGTRSWTLDSINSLTRPFDASSRIGVGPMKVIAVVAQGVHHGPLSRGGSRDG